MGHLARSRMMMGPERAAVMIVLICLGAGVVADGYISRLSRPRAPIFLSPLQESKIKSVNEKENLSECPRNNATSCVSLSEFLWGTATDLLQHAWKTTFIAGVAAGNLDPTFYGDYTMQDAAWCREVAKLWRRLANNASVDEELRAYGNRSYESYQRCSTTLFVAWNIKDDGEDNYGVNIQAAATNYVKTIRDAMLKNPPNMMIATFACVKLWSNLTTDLWSEMTSRQTNCSNPYERWVERNKGSSSAKRQAAKIDEWDDEKCWYNWAEALTLFRQVMKGEINMFNLKQHKGLQRNVDPPPMKCIA